MGYCIELEESTLVIKKETAENVVTAIKDFAKNASRLSWIDKDYLLDAENIEDVFSEIRYELNKNENGDYEIDYFSGEKLGNDLVIFNSFAQFIENGQYIEMLGEDGERWRWIFINGKCEEIIARVVWDN